jgi:hypothetical protein
MVRVGHAKAENSGIATIQWVTRAAEELVVPARWFELVPARNRVRS